MSSAAIGILSDPSISCNVFRFSHVTLDAWMGASLMTNDALKEFNAKLLDLVEESVMANLTGTNGRYFTRPVRVLGLGIDRYIHVARRAIENRGRFTFDQMVNNIIVGAFEYLVSSTNIDTWVDTGFKVRFPLNVESSLREMNVDYLLGEMWDELLGGTNLALTEISNVGTRRRAIRALGDRLDSGGCYEDALSEVRRVYHLPPFKSDQLRAFCDGSWGDKDLAGHVVDIVNSCWGVTYLMSRQVPVFDWASNTPQYR